MGSEEGLGLGLAEEKVPGSVGVSGGVLVGVLDLVLGCESVLE